jgi:hypothetical protein
MGLEAFDSTWNVWLRFALSALAVYRVAFLVAREDGPMQMFQRLRVWTKDSGAGRIVACVNCLTVWLSLPFAAFVGGSWVERLVAWWALSGAAVLMDRATRDPFEIEAKERSS